MEYLGPFVDPAPPPPAAPAVSSRAPKRTRTTNDDEEEVDEEEDEAGPSSKRPRHSSESANRPEAGRNQTTFDLSSTFVSRPSSLPPQLDLSSTFISNPESRRSLRLSGASLQRDSLPIVNDTLRLGNHGRGALDFRDSSLDFGNGGEQDERATSQGHGALDEGLIRTTGLI